MFQGLKTPTLLALLFSFSWLTGCASAQQPVTMAPEVWQESNETIGIAVTELPKPDTVLAGNQGLLDLAFNASMASSLTNKVHTWDVNALNDTPSQVQKILEQQGYKTKLLGKLDISKLKELPSKEGYAGLDYSTLKSKEGINKLILFLPTAAGTYRTYYSVMPTSDPIAQVGINSFVIDLDDNRLLHYQTVVMQRSAAGDWDEGPEFPNLTNAFYQALDMSQQALLVPFKQPVFAKKQQ